MIMHHSYNYKSERPNIFLEENQKLFIRIRDQTLRHIKDSGAVTLGVAAALPTGIGAADSFTMMACVDRLVELGDIKEIPTVGWAQYRIFVDKSANVRGKCLT